MNINKEKLEEIKSKIQNRIEDGMVAACNFMQKHPVISTAIGTMAGAAITGVITKACMSRPEIVRIDYDGGTTDLIPTGDIFMKGDAVMFTDRGDAAAFVGEKVKTIEDYGSGYGITREPDGYKVGYIWFADEN